MLAHMKNDIFPFNYTTMFPQMLILCYPVPLKRRPWFIESIIRYTEMQIDVSQVSKIMRCSVGYKKYKTFVSIIRIVKLCKFSRFVTIVLSA